MPERLEEKLIGAILNKTATLDDVAEISSLDFADTQKALIFETARTMMLEGQDVDAHSLYDQIARREVEAFYSSSDFLRWSKIEHNLFSTIQSFQKVGLYQAIKQQLQTWSDALENCQPSDSAKVLERIAGKVSELQSEYAGGLNLSFKFLSELAPRMEKLYTDLKSGIAINVPTGFNALDKELLGGFAKGDLIIINGFTGRGKTALMLNIGINQAKEGYCAGIVSREMTEEENFIRIHTKATSEIYGRNQSGYTNGVRRGDIVRNMDEYTYKILMESLPYLKDLPIAIDTKTSDIFQLKKQAKIMVEHHGMATLMVDYLQLMKSHKKYDTESSKLEEISHELKGIATDHKIPVVALSQYNEEAKKISPSERFEKQKGSSAIKQDASVIIEVDFDNSTPSSELEAQVVIRKNRNGQCHIPLSMRYYGASFEFTEVYG